jgi:hypothetical protein
MEIKNPVDYRAEVFDLIQYVTGLADGRIFRGNQSREVLPRDGDYVIYTPISQKRIGTNIPTLYAADVDPTKNAPEVDEKLLQIDFQLDFYGGRSFLLSDGFETFCHSLRCLDWLKQTGKKIRVLYATNPVDATLVDDTKQYIERWILTLAICYGAAVSDDIPWIEDVVVIPNPNADKPIDPDDPSPPIPPSKYDGTKLVNVDIEYNPKE